MIKQFYVNNDKLKKYAENVAKSIDIHHTGKSSKTADNLREKLVLLYGNCKKLSQYGSEYAILPAELEWLLDNRYLAEREGKSALIDIRRSASLGILKNGKPAVLEAAEALVRAGDDSITSERVKLFLEGFQNGMLLRESELGLFISCLKIALVSSLADKSTELLRLYKNECETESARPLNDTTRAYHSEYTGQLKKIFDSLRLVYSQDWSELLEDVNCIEQLFRSDPSGIYTKMDHESRAAYRWKLFVLSRRYGITEFEAAKRILELASSHSGVQSHIGYYLREDPLGLGKHKRSETIYAAFILLPSLFLSLLLSFAVQQPAVAVLSFLPFWEIIKNTVDFTIAKCTPPDRIPMLDLSKGIPEEGKTLCVISTLLTSKSNAEAIVDLLEEYKLANRNGGDNLLFGILADLPESKSLDIDASGIRQAQTMIDELNSRYSEEFYLFGRDRIYRDCDGVYMGWERKRGAILELMYMLRGHSSNIYILSGNKSRLKNIQYLITLDADTRLNIGTASEMVGAMMHPLNRPEIDSTRRIVKRGYGLLQPRISVDLNSANKSNFTRFFAGQGGVDPYGSHVSDIYQDVFGEGIYTGKGIIDIDAYLTCLYERFPENQILSHDLLEGCYLHAGYLSCVELTDGFPSQVRSYFERMHRWIRGDWQIISWLTRNVRDQNKTKVKNPLKSLHKWKIFDNLRRSLLPAVYLAAIALAVFTWQSTWIAAAAVCLLSIVSSQLVSAISAVFRQGSAHRARYHATVVHGFSGGLIQSIIQLILLPHQAWICLNAVTAACWRMLISKRKLLQWTTAKEAEKKKGGVFSYIKAMWFSVGFGALVLVFSIHPLGKALGLIWLLAPLFAYDLSRQLSENPALEERDKCMLSNCAGDIWRYFETFIGPDDNWLPPDNWQEQPSVGIAHRTSPTNIGLALLSAVSAIDLKLCTAEKGISIIKNILESIMRLSKWNGHLYNWYDTRSTLPLNPRYVSTVDSGNFAGCLIVLNEALKEFPETEGMRECIDKLLEDMDFRLLYDEHRKLFYIGVMPDSPQKRSEHYDLLSSEARQTSYIAIALGHVGKKHWRNLGRAMTEIGGYRGMVSWSGTMFEYLMPNLILPNYRNSLIDESLRLCVYAQKRAGSPWGMSESAFYSFDGEMNYQYKAHGIQRLSLKRGMAAEKVIAPYSSFLALLIDPRSSVRNLKKLRKMGMEGRFGFYEAVDFTPSRVDSGAFQPVRCFMAHHLGMSLTAIDNAICDNIMQKRFLQNASMRAYAELLQERVPIGQVVLSTDRRELPEKPRIQNEKFVQAIARPTDEQSFILSNGTYHVLFAASGSCTSYLHGGTVINGPNSQFEDDDSGILFFIKNGESVIALQAAQSADTSGYQTEFSEESVKFTMLKDGIESLVEAVVPRGDLGELRSVFLKNVGSKPLEAELILYLKPILSDAKAYSAHKTFAKLMTRIETERDFVRFYSRSSGYFAYLICSDPFFCGLTGEHIIGRGGQRALKTAISNEFAGNDYTGSDPVIAVSVPLKLNVNESRSIRFALAVGTNADETLLSAKRILAFAVGEKTSRFERICRRFGIQMSEKTLSVSLLSELVRSRYSGSLCPDKLNGGQQGLWKLGISGDFPIVTVLVNTENQSRAVSYIKAQALWRENGYQFDLAFITDDIGEYQEPISGFLKEQLRILGLENTIGSRGGVFFVRSDTVESENLMAMSDKLVPDTGIQRKRAEKNTWRFKHGAPLRWMYEKDGSFKFSGLPPVAWSNLLTNENYGFLATDAGCGHMWHNNSRENKINPWTNDFLSDRGTETIELLSNGQAFSLFNAEDGIPGSVRYGLGYAIWEREIGTVTVSMTAFVPPDTNARILIIHVNGANPEDTVLWRCQLLMGSGDSTSKGIRVLFSEHALTAQNSSGAVFHMIGKEKSYYELPAPTAELRFSADETIVLVCGCEDIPRLMSLTDPAAAKSELEKTKSYWTDMVCRLSIKSPDYALDRYMNGWVLYQVIACRLFARTSLYQCGGALGFRDQLQDTCALIQFWPERVREQLIEACKHQYEEGDVQHWWHPHCGPQDKGMRTRCSDDLLWLTYVLCKYCLETDDLDICNVQVNFISSPVLSENEMERYESPVTSSTSASVFEHAVLAAEKVLSRGFGSHGLALIGSGDWNDGFSKVGIQGKGESVWLSWFLSIVLQQLSELCLKLGYESERVRYSEKAKTVALAAENTFNGSWYLRGYFDDGTPIGAEGSKACSIDSIAQSFAAFCPYSDPGHAVSAVKAAKELLFDKQHNVIRLFTPPFDIDGPDPGYIRNYLPGIRENGGQYTHAAVWLAMACFRCGLKDDGWELLHAILPLSHDHQKFMTEPYVLAGDVYSGYGRDGRGGWSWYTGAAAWYFRAVCTELLGLKFSGGKLYISPALPQKWNDPCNIVLDFKRFKLKICLNPSNEKAFYFDGSKLEDGIDLKNLTGEHTITNELSENTEK